MKSRSLKTSFQYKTLDTALYFASMELQKKLENSKDFRYIYDFCGGLSLLYDTPRLIVVIKLARKYFHRLLKSEKQPGGPMLNTSISLQEVDQMARICGIPREEVLLNMLQNEDFMDSVSEKIDTLMYNLFYNKIR